MCWYLLDHIRRQHMCIPSRAGLWPSEQHVGGTAAVLPLGLHARRPSRDGGHSGWPSCEHVHSVPQQQQRRRQQQHYGPRLQHHIFGKKPAIRGASLPSRRSTYYAHGLQGPAGTWATKVANPNNHRVDLHFELCCMFQVGHKGKSWRARLLVEIKQGRERSWQKSGFLPLRSG